MHNLNSYLFDNAVANELRHMILDVARAAKYAAYAIRTEGTGLAQSQNTHGEDQLALDVRCDDIFHAILSEADLLACFASEEQEELVVVNGDKGKFSVAFDPLDGSSLLNTNGPVGTIFGIWEGNGFIGKKGKDLVASGYVQYGPRTTLTLAVNGKTHMFTLSDVGEFHLSEENITIASDAKIFAPGNLRAMPERPDYQRVMEYFFKTQKTLRYAGGMVPDINSILCKKNGIFLYPSHSKYPKGKLRLLYECAPMALVMENAGGKAVDEKGNPILDIAIDELHQKTTIILGSSAEVDTILEMLDM